LLSDADVGLAPATTAPLSKAPAGGGGVSFEDAVGRAPAGWTDAEFGLPARPPAARSLTVHGSAPPKPAGDGGVSFQDAVGAPSKLMSDADVGLPPASSGWSDEQFGLPSRNADTAAARGLGPLTNTQDDSWLSGAAKGAVTAAIKGGSHIIGQFGDTNDLASFLAAGVGSLFSGRSSASEMVDLKAKQAAWEASTPWYYHPFSFPSSGDVSAPVLAKTGEYVPTSEVGKLAQAGVETAAGGLGPGSGAANVAKAAGEQIAGRTIRQAPLNAVAGVAGQGATDATGNPYVGLGASLLAPSGAEAAGQSMSNEAADGAGEAGEDGTGSLGNVSTSGAWD
jgi:hypothetical protein